MRPNAVNGDIDGARAEFGQSGAAFRAAASTSHGKLFVLKSPRTRAALRGTGAARLYLHSHARPLFIRGSIRFDYHELSPRSIMPRKFRRRS